MPNIRSENVPKSHFMEWASFARTNLTDHDNHIQNEVVEVYNNLNKASNKKELADENEILQGFIRGINHYLDYVTSEQPKNLGQFFVTYSNYKTKQETAESSDIELSGFQGDEMDLCMRQFDAFVKMQKTHPEICKRVIKYLTDKCYNGDSAQLKEDIKKAQKHYAKTQEDLQAINSPIFSNYAYKPDGTHRLSDVSAMTMDDISYPYNELKEFADHIYSEIKHWDSVWSKDSDEIKAMREASKQLHHLVHESNPYDIQKALDQFKTLQNKAQAYHDKKERQEKNDRRMNRYWIADMIISHPSPDDHDAMMRYKNNVLSIPENERKKQFIEQTKEIDKTSAYPDKLEEQVNSFDGMSLI